MLGRRAACSSACPAAPHQGQPARGQAPGTWHCMGSRWGQAPPWSRTDSTARRKGELLERPPSWRRRTPPDPATGQTLLCKPSSTRLQAQQDPAAPVLHHCKLQDTAVKGQGPTHPLGELPPAPLGSSNDVPRLVQPGFVELGRLLPVSLHACTPILCGPDLLSMLRNLQPCACMQRSSQPSPACRQSVDSCTTEPAPEICLPSRKAQERQAVNCEQLSILQQAVSVPTCTWGAWPACRPTCSRSWVLYPKYSTEATSNLVRAETFAHSNAQSQVPGPSAGLIEQERVAWLGTSLYSCPTAACCG